MLISGSFLGRRCSFSIRHELHVILFLEQLLMLLRSVTTEHGAGNCLSTDAGNQQFALYFMSKFRLDFVLSLG